MSFRYRFLTSLVSGGLLGLAWPPVGWWPFALVCPGLLALCLHRADTRSRFLFSVGFFTAAWSIAFHWNALHPNAVTALSSIVALFCMITFQAALITAFSSSPRQQDTVSSAIFGLFGIALWDAFMFYGPVAMPGTMLGLSVSESFLATGWVPVVGSFGLTWIVLAFNAIWVGLFLSRRGYWVGAFALSALLAAPFMARQEEPTDGPELSVTSVQPGYAPEAWANVYSDSKADALFGMLQTAKQLYPETDVFVLPETALPVSTGDELDSVSRLWSDSLNAGIVTGAIQQTIDNRYYNAVVSAFPGLLPIQYLKRRLVPFVESVPLADFLPFSESFRLESGGVPSYESGTDWTLIDVGGHKVGVLICFESFFPQDGRHLRTLGAEALIVVTQDGWWQSRTARRQHEAYTRLMALSSGIPVVQASVDGISANWDARGTVLARSLGTEFEIIHSKIPMRPVDTAYARTGETPSIVFLSLVLILYLGRLAYFRRSP